MTNRYVTKYFKQSDCEYYEKGQLKFGTLVSYGQGENAKLARMRDSEGAAVDAFDVSHISGFSADLPGVKMRDVVFGEYVSVRIHRKLNDWIWCASIGSYGSEHHRNMLFGSGDYEGDPMLTNYAVFDADLLGSALGSGCIDVRAGS